MQVMYHRRENFANLIISSGYGKWLSPGQACCLSFWQTIGPVPPKCAYSAVRERVPVLSMTLAPARSMRPRSAPAGKDPSNLTVADFLRRLGGIPAARVRLEPTPGTATEKDVIRVLGEENRPCELAEGTLVEKAISYEESEIAAYLIT
jgi:hypothetical protein